MCFPFRRWLTFFPLLSLMLGLAACQATVPSEALQLSQESLQQRQLQTRRFDSADETKILAAGAGVLQDLGFTIENSDTQVGLIFATKDRDAVETGQVVGALFVGLLFGVQAPIDQTQKIRVSLISAPLPESGATKVRITFQRIVWDNRGAISRIEALNQPQLYQEFFDKLGQSLFLAAHQI